jgi:hypothetical protein
MNFADQDRQLRSLVARASSPCFGQAGSLSHHFLTDNRITDFACQISSGLRLARTTTFMFCVEKSAVGKIADLDIQFA